MNVFYVFDVLFSMFTPVYLGFFLIQFRFNIKKKICNECKLLTFTKKVEEFLSMCVSAYLDTSD